MHTDVRVITGFLGKDGCSTCYPGYLGYLSVQLLSRRYYFAFSTERMWSFKHMPPFLVSILPHRKYVRQWPPNLHVCQKSKEGAGQWTKNSKPEVGWKSNTGKGYVKWRRSGPSLYWRLWFAASATDPQPQGAKWIRCWEWRQTWVKRNHRCFTPGEVGCLHPREKTKSAPRNPICRFLVLSIRRQLRRGASLENRMWR